MSPEIDRLADVAGSIVSADLGYRKCTTVFDIIIVIISNEHIYIFLNCHQAGPIVKT